MSLKQYIPAIKYGNTLSSDELDPNAALSNGQINAAIAQSTTVALTAAQLISMGTTPVQLITTSTAGTAIVVDSILFEMIPTSTTFTMAGASQVQFQYGTTTTTGNIMTNVIPQSVVTSGSAGYIVANPTTTTAGVTVVPNAGITITNTGNLNFAAGTGTAKVFLNYYIVTI